MDCQRKRCLQSTVNNLVYYQGGSFALAGYDGPGREYFVNVRVNI